MEVAVLNAICLFISSLILFIIKETIPNVKMIKIANHLVVTIAILYAIVYKALLNETVMLAVIISLHTSLSLLDIGILMNNQSVSYYSFLPLLVQWVTVLFKLNKGFEMMKMLDYSVHCFGILHFKNENFYFALNHFFHVLVVVYYYIPFPNVIEFRSFQFLCHFISIVCDYKSTQL